VKELVFVGLGLHDDSGISLRGLNEAKRADSLFIESYTSLLPGFSLARFERVSGRKLRPLSRRDLEEDSGRVVLEAAEKGSAVLLVPGDPLVATTHVALRIAAEKRGIRTRIVHGASILSAVVGLSGLQNYKFGRSVTIPFPEDVPGDTPYMVIVQNLHLGLHTLCLLDIKVEERRYLSIHEGLEELLRVEGRRKRNIVTADTLAVGIARAGSPEPVAKADSLRYLLDYDFGKPPHSLVLPGKLHFMEAEALVVLCGASERMRATVE
jgi:diphthine synthase